MWPFRRRDRDSSPDELATLGDAPAPRSPDRFPRARHGYAIDEVEAFLARADSCTAQEIRRVQFNSARHGYDLDAVDNELDRLEEKARREGR